MDLIENSIKPGDTIESKTGKNVFLMDTPGNRFAYCKRKSISLLTCEALVLNVHCFVSDLGNTHIQYLVECGTETGWVDSFEVRLKSINR